MKSMKNLPLSLLALAGLLLTAACTSDDDLLSASESEELCTLTFNVCTNGSVSTRSDDSSTSSSISDGTTATKLYYGVYAVTAITSTDDDGNSTSNTSYTLASSISNIEGSTPTWTDLATTVNISLAKGNSYAIVFWAESEYSPYKLDFEGDTPTMTYSNTSNLVANSDDYDAFYAVYKTGTVTGNASVDVDLTRPFAQINFGTDDLLSYNSSVTGTLAYTKVTVSGVYTTLNLLTGEATGDTSSNGTSTSLTFGYSAYPNSDDADTGTFPYQPTTDDGSTTYDYLAMCYVLLGADAVTADAVTLYYSSTTSDEDNHSLQVTSVPLQRNYRTNIYGSLLTGSYSMNVSKASNYDESYNNPVYVATADELSEALATELVTDVLLTTNIEVTSQLTVTGDKEVDLQDNTLTLSYSDDAEVSLATADTELTVSNGTIKSSKKTAFSISASDVSLTLDDVDVSSVQYLVNVASNGDNAQVTVSDSSLTLESGSYLINNEASNATVTLDNDKISAYVVYRSSGSNSAVEISDCKIETTWGIVTTSAASSAEITISGTTISTSKYAVYPQSDGVKVTVTDTTVEGTGSTPFNFPTSNVDVTMDNVSITSTNSSSESSAIKIGNATTSSATSGGTLKLTNSTIDVSESSSMSGIVACGSGAEITVEGCTIIHAAFGIQQNGTYTSGSKFTVSNTTIKGPYSGIYLSCNASSTTYNTLTVNNSCSITSTEESAIEVKKTNITVDNSKLIATCESSSNTYQSYELNRSGSGGGYGFGIVLAGHTSGTEYEGTVNLSSITYELGESYSGDKSSWYNVCYYNGSEGVDYTKTTDTPSDGSTTA